MTTELAITYAKRKDAGDLNSKEDAALKDWIDHASREEYNKFYNACFQYVKFVRDNDFSGHIESKEKVTGNLDKDILKDVSAQETQPGLEVYRIYNTYKIFWNTAAALLICLAGAWFYFSADEPKEEIVMTDEDEIQTKQNNHIAEDEGMDIVIVDSFNLINSTALYTNKIRFDSLILTPSAYSTGSVETDQRVITVPSGHHYKVLLPDRSRVWLNARSTLVVPASYGISSRNVELSGEGYFSISEDANMPFKVKTGDITVSVLGTIFNINSYDNEPEKKITLVEGSVKVEGKQINNILKEGEQVVILEDNLSITKVDTDRETNWMVGYFDFNNTDIYHLLRQLERWYDIKVIIQNLDMRRHKRYSGTISKNMTFANIKNTLNLLKIKIEMKGKQALVTLD